jgi:hypothetical protein
VSKQYRSANKTSSRPLWVRILAIALTALLCSGALVYLIMFFMNIFG